MPSGNPEIGLAEIVDLEMVVEIIPGKSATTSKIFSVEFIWWSDSELSILQQPAGEK